MSATTEVVTHEQSASAEQSLVEREQNQSCDLGAMDGLDLLLLLALLPLHWSLFFLVVAQWFVRRNPRLLAGLLSSAGSEGLVRSSAAAEYLPGLRQLQQEQQVVRPAVRPAAPADDALLTGLLTRAAPSASASASSTVTIAAAPVPWRTWRIWAVTAHHLLIIGNTNSGKTTLVRALLPGKRGTILVIDPKNRPGKWGSITAIGLDDDAEYIQIEQALQMVLAELRQRQRALNQGQTDFPPLTVVVDEAPDVADECATFPTLFKRVGSIGRELHISLMALSQRSTVKSLGIIGDGQARDNFTKILMGSFARRAVPALEGQTHGAVLDRDGKQSVLDVAPLPTYARLPVEHAVAWPFPGLLHDDRMNPPQATPLQWQW